MAGLFWQQSTYNSTPWCDLGLLRLLPEDWATENVGSFNCMFIESHTYNLLRWPINVTNSHPGSDYLQLNMKAAWILSWMLQEGNTLGAQWCDTACCLPNPAFHCLHVYRKRLPPDSNLLINTHSLTSLFTSYWRLFITQYQCLAIKVSPCSYQNPWLTF